MNKRDMEYSEQTELGHVVTMMTTQSYPWCLVKAWVAHSAICIGRARVDHLVD